LAEARTLPIGKITYTALCDSAISLRHSCAKARHQREGASLLAKEYDMAAETNALQRWEGYRPSKALWFWSCVGAAILTIIVGFWAGGWTTGGTAKQMAKAAADKARAELVANACVKNFVNGSDFQTRLAAFKGVDTWKRAGVLEEKGWVTLAGMEKPLAAAAKLCADELAKVEPSDANVPVESAGDSRS
jgi:hypothetical protein